MALVLIASRNELLKQRRRKDDTSTVSTSTAPSDQTRSYQDLKIFSIIRYTYAGKVSCFPEYALSNLELSTLIRYTRNSSTPLPLRFRFHSSIRTVVFKNLQTRNSRGSFRRVAGGVSLSEVNPRKAELLFRRARIRWQESRRSPSDA